MSRCRRGPYLEHRTAVRVRFQEVDALQVVWHGHYLSYFEDARAAFGDRYGFGVQDFLEAGLLAPVVETHCRYLLPARLGDTLEVCARWYPCEAARIEFSYSVYGSGARLLAEGRSVQVYTDRDWNLCLTLPALARDFYTRWQPELVQPDA